MKGFDETAMKSKLIAKIYGICGFVFFYKVDLSLLQGFVGWQLSSGDSIEQTASSTTADATRKAAICETRAAIDRFGLASPPFSTNPRLCTDLGSQWPSFAQVTEVSTLIGGNEWNTEEENTGI